MSYVEGFVLAVPAANKETYREHAARAAPLFKEFGATRMVENWGDDVPDGKLTDFKRAVKAKPDEVVLFSWFEYPDKATRDKANEKMRSDPRMKAMGAEMPFDGQRMIFGGFAPIVDERGSGKMGYVDGFVVPVPDGNKETYREMATKAATKFKQYGAVRIVEAWGDDVPDGKVTDFKGAVQSTPGEKIVYSWIEWPSKEARDEGWKKMMAEPHPETMPFDGKRMIWGGFSPIVVA
jgi:uncharacterized protein YbaA (DUF1428 family)